VLWSTPFHEFTFGADFSRREANLLRPEQPARHLHLHRRGNGLNGNSANGGGLDFADFLIGAPDSMALNVTNSLSGAQAAQLGTASGSTLANPSDATGYAERRRPLLADSVYDVYANDQWRLTPRLSLSLGVRWDYQAPTTELYGRLATIDLPANFQVPLSVYNGLPSTGLSVVAGQTGPVSASSTTIPC
jgi:outer membrane receptor protein involved in Fe transport